MRGIRHGGARCDQGRAIMGLRSWKDLLAPGLFRSCPAISCARRARREPRRTGGEPGSERIGTDSPRCPAGGAGRTEGPLPWAAQGDAPSQRRPAGAQLVAVRRSGAVPPSLLIPPARPPRCALPAARPAVARPCHGGGGGRGAQGDAAAAGMQACSWQPLIVGRSARGGDATAAGMQACSATPGRSRAGA